MVTQRNRRQMAGCLTIPIFIFLFSSMALAYTEVPSGTIGNATWGPGTVYATGSIVVGSGATLTIQSGTVVKFAASARLTVYGTLSADGTVADDIVFTSRDDDTYGDKISGSDESPNSGDWRGIYLYGSGTGNEDIGNFDYCRIRYGGSTCYSNDNLNFYYSDTGDFNNSISEFSQNDGIQIHNASLDILNSTLSNNVQTGINCIGSPSTITNTIVWGNGGDAMDVSGTATPLVVYSDIEGGYPGEGNIDADPLFTDASAGDYTLRPCSPAIDAGDSVERLRQAYTANDTDVLVEAVTNITVGNLIWITDGLQSGNDSVAGTSADTISLDNGFVNAYAMSESVFLFKPSSDFTGEPEPNGRRINMGALGGSALAETTPQPPEIADIDGVVNILDKVAVRNDFGTSGPPGWNPADVNWDGVVNILDKVVVRNEFGQSGCACD